MGRDSNQGHPLPSRFPHQDELARIGAHRELVFRYHVVGCRQLRSQDLLEEGYVTTLSGHPLRFSEREVSRGPTPDISGPQTQDSAVFNTQLLCHTLCPHEFKTLSFPLDQGGLQGNRVDSCPDPAHYHEPVPGLRTSELGPLRVSCFPLPPGPAAVSLGGR